MLNRLAGHEELLTVAFKMVTGFGDSRFVYHLLLHAESTGLSRTQVHAIAGSGLQTSGRLRYR